MIMRKSPHKHSDLMIVTQFTFSKDIICFKMRARIACVVLIKSYESLWRVLVPCYGHHQNLLCNLLLIKRNSNRILIAQCKKWSHHSNDTSYQIDYDLRQWVLCRRVEKSIFRGSLCHQQRSLLLRGQERLTWTDEIAIIDSGVQVMSEKMAQSQETLNSSMLSKEHNLDQIRLLRWDLFLITQETTDSFITLAAVN